MTGKSKRKATCLSCEIEFIYTMQSSGKYCSLRCTGDAKKADTRRRFLAGELSERPIIKRYVVERDGYNCKECGIADYNGKAITLQLDHIDGCAANNMPDNFQLLCPNCHSQSPHFSGRNKGKGRKALGLRTN